MTKTLTLEYLDEHHACTAAKRRFERAFPFGIELTEASIAMHAGSIIREFSTHDAADFFDLIDRDDLDNCPACNRPGESDRDVLLRLFKTLQEKGTFND